MQEVHAELVEFLQPYPAHVRELMLDGREFLLTKLGPVTELLFDATSAVCFGFCYTHSPSDNFVNFAAYSGHVTLVFAWGALLEDPEGRLRGEGKQVRNLRLKDLSTLRDPYVLGLIDQAAENSKRSTEPFVPTRIIKVYDGPKRRPNP